MRSCWASRRTPVVIGHVPLEWCNCAGLRVLSVEGPSCEASRDHANGSRGRTHHTMALDQSALLEVLDALKAADVEDRIRRRRDDLPGADRGRADRGDRRRPARAHRRPDRAAQRAPAEDVSTTAGDLELRSRSCGPGRSSRPCSSGAAGSTSRCSRWSWRPTCTARRRARSTTWSRPSAPTPGSPSPRSRGSAPTSTPRSPRSPTGPWPSSAFPYVFLDATYCKARRRERQGSGRVPGRRGRHRRRG